MENTGEHIVGQYLRYIKSCDFVEYNLQTEFTQGEIDIVAINSTKNIVYICEVATHLETGLQYTKNGKPDNVKRFVSKFEKNIKYAKANFKEYEHKFMLWTPIVKIPKKANPVNNQLQDLSNIQEKILNKYNTHITLIYNETFLKNINQLRQISLNTTQAMNSPIMRFLQIEEKLNQHCEKI